MRLRQKGVLADLARRMSPRRLAYRGSSGVGKWGASDAPSQIATAANPPSGPAAVIESNVRLRAESELDRPVRPGTKIVPLLITLDLEIAPDHDHDEQQAILGTLRKNHPATPITAFVTGDAVERFAGPVRDLAAAGHEFGCHGLTHALDEDFRRMPRARLQSVLGESTARIERITGQRPRVFRGPRMATSADTQRTLIDLGYAADFSVCPQRLDVLNCRGADLGWLAAPRVPYRASADSPYRRGELPLTVVPLSTLGIPLISGSLFLFGLTAMKLLFRGLLAEARRTGAPLVYLFHSYEFTRFLGGAARPLHQRLYTSDPARRLSLHRQFLRFMLAQRGVVPVTASTFLQRWPAKSTR